MKAQEVPQPGLMPQFVSTCKTHVTHPKPVNGEVVQVPSSVASWTGCTVSNFVLCFLPEHEPETSAALKMKWLVDGHAAKLIEPQTEQGTTCAVR